ncbi:hypothetical protein BDV96DRAFT_607684 [Lophiotrema nucula]|uniref:Uncharacterized protein n=1 Tax=Lophiotrema nucula TaxID=690887 RepID=A0A6A5YH30_9PLEO|nr:hypothetical protein BDV96DRAFT_607684 [Lophiotrema nucula]
MGQKPSRPVSSTPITSKSALKSIQAVLSSTAESRFTKESKFHAEPLFSTNTAPKMQPTSVVTHIRVPSEEWYIETARRHRSGLMNRETIRLGLAVQEDIVITDIIGYITQCVQGAGVVKISHDWQVSSQGIAIRDRVLETVHRSGRWSVLFGRPRSFVAPALAPLRLLSPFYGFGLPQSLGSCDRIVVRRLPPEIPHYNPLHFHNRSSLEQELFVGGQRDLAHSTSLCMLNQGFWSNGVAAWSRQPAFAHGVLFPRERTRSSLCGYNLEVLVLVVRCSWQQLHLRLQHLED